jgi:hypothetical protein
VIVNNKLVFGYGDIAVGQHWCGLAFTQIKPPTEIGSSIHRDDSSLDKETERKIVIRPCDIDILGRLLDSVTNDNPVFKFNGFIFDFTLFNQESVNAVRRKLRTLSDELLYILPYAC